MTSNPERWEKAWTEEFVQGKRLFTIWAHGDGVLRRVAECVYEKDADHICDLHNASLARPGPAAGETGLLEEALTLLREWIDAEWMHSADWSGYKIREEFVEKTHAFLARLDAAQEESKSE